jgi:hypothetical protein
LAYLILDNNLTLINYRKELEQKLKEAKKRKKEKFALKLKAMEELSEKEKNKWKSFNTKVSDE